MKQKDNPKFSFLFGGEHFDYYTYKLTTEQLTLKKQQFEQNRQAGFNMQPTPSSNQQHPPNTIAPTTTSNNSNTNWPQFNQPPAISADTCTTQITFLQKQITQLQEQLQQSEKNLHAQREVIKINRKVIITAS